MLGSGCTFDPEVISQPPLYGKNWVSMTLSNLQAMPLRQISSYFFKYVFY